MRYYLLGSLMITLALVSSCKQDKKQNADDEVAKVEARYTCAPPTMDTLWYKSGNKAPLFAGLDVLNYPITTTNPEANRYFNQGLVLAYGFNHAEAARSFYYATKLDPESPMCYWGYAYVLGPNYNAGMEPDNYERAYEAIQKAIILSEKGTVKEQGLIKALAKRYVQEPVDDRSELDIAYAEAMKDLYLKYPDDPEISTLYAESIMNLHPWDLQDKEGKDKSWTPEIITLLERLIRKNPDHPGAHHFYIHATEASDRPERSMGSAAVFDKGLVPGAGHLLHMPSHTYIRTGDYHLGTLSNIRAVEADSLYTTQCHAQGAYPLAYYPHNYHFMAATATLEGNYYYAMLGANKLAEGVHPDIMKSPGWGTVQHYYVTPYYVAIKFGKWEEILDMRLKNYGLPYVEAIEAYARGMALLGVRKPEKAKDELIKLERISEDPTLEEVSIWDINTVVPVVQIAKRVLRAEIMASEKRYDESLVLLKEAVALEDGLNYNEPPDWFFSVRHHLGAVQIEAALYKDAVETYKQDLETFPKNGWAQHGLKLAYEKAGMQSEASEIDTMLKESWATADTDILSSRIK
ncbi:tetratricopeptide repeat protein [Robertkochia solimangrovi]|uniref:tetratricopeptide repeat protein n=1 Tax=Robertkochia solimangrovi TaxID=2213046 RepID=UPI00117CC6AE|nr:hypothetical protein [Robertkochia solimangrovi]TRZ42923.1 hypothetical protein DMZ48_12725 [Robertkochia solimangrovi]